MLCCSGWLLKLAILISDILIFFQMCPAVGFLYFLFYFKRMVVLSEYHLHAGACEGQKRRADPWNDRYKWLWVTTRVVGLYSSPVVEQPILLTTEPSPALHYSFQWLHTTSPDITPSYCLNSPLRTGILVIKPYCKHQLGQTALGRTLHTLEQLFS